MKDPELLRTIYNNRFSGAAGHWTSEDIERCKRVASRVIKWTGLVKIQGSKMLDVGCALGYYTRAFYLNGFDSYGLDYSEVAISRATVLHPECHFIHADGFDPKPGIKFDLIFCRGFSGANTHDLKFVASWSNKYIDLLNPGGKFVFSCSTNYSGKETSDETVNWTSEEIQKYISLVNASFSGIRYYYRYYFASRLLSVILSFVKRTKAKRYFYIIFSR